MTQARWIRNAWLAVVAMLIAACGSPRVGIGIPVATGVAVGVGTGGVSVGAGVGYGPLGAGVRVNQQGRVSAGAGAGTGPVHAGVSLHDSGEVRVGTGVTATTRVDTVSAGVGVGGSASVTTPPDASAGPGAPERRPPSIWD